MPWPYAGSRGWVPRVASTGILDESEGFPAFAARPPAPVRYPPERPVLRATCRISMTGEEYIEQYATATVNAGEAVAFMLDAERGP